MDHVTNIYGPRAKPSLIDADLSSEGFVDRSWPIAKMPKRPLSIRTSGDRPGTIDKNLLSILSVFEIRSLSISSEIKVTNTGALHRLWVTRPLDICPNSQLAKILSPDSARLVRIRVTITRVLRSRGRVMYTRPPSAIGDISNGQDWQQGEAYLLLVYPLCKRRLREGLPCLLHGLRAGHLQAHHLLQQASSQGEGRSILRGGKECMSM